MAHMETRWEKTDGRVHREEKIAPVKAKQGRTGKRILTVLIVALALAFVVWIPVEIWGKREADQVLPQQPGQQMQQGVPTQSNNSPSTQPATPAQ